MIRVFLALVVIWPVAAAALPDHVLLIGVTDYDDEVAEIAQPLDGPGNDVALMYQVFRSAGVPKTAFDILTDQPAALTSERWETDLPTRNAILMALDRLADQARGGSEIAIFLAGHGAQVPAISDSSEPDGLDEVFLPLDFRIGSEQTYSGAIADHEIGARIDRMVEAGAHVWLIADTCHSGSLRRSDGLNAVPRMVNLSTSQTGLADPGDIVELRPKTSGVGSFVGFFAAAAGSLAFEVQPQESDRTHGSLTWALARELRKTDAPSYRALAAGVSGALFQIDRGRATPTFSGALEQTPMLVTSPQRRDTFAITVSDDIAVSAGRLDGLAPGARIAVIAEDGDVLFETAVTEATLLGARAQLPTGPTPRLDARLRAEKLDPDRFRRRWLVDRAPTLTATAIERSMDLTLRVLVSDKALSTDLATAARDQITSLSPLATLVETKPDVFLEEESSRVYVRPASPGASEAMSVSVGNMSDLPNLLRRVAKSQALLSVGDILSESDLSRTLFVETTVAPGTENNGQCHSARDPANLGSSLLKGPLTVGHCSEVTLSVTNSGASAVDITPLYIAADQHVYFLDRYHGSERGGWRIPPGATETLSYIEATRTSDGELLATGAMHLLLLAVAAQTDGDPVDFRYLRDLAPPAKTRSGETSPMAQLLEIAGFGLALKRSIGQHELGKSGAIIVPVETIADDRDDATQE